MAGSLVERAMRVLEMLGRFPQGLPLQTVADRLNLPKSGAHRLLTELVQLGYLAQDPRNQAYLPATKLMALGFRQLGACGFGDVAQPVLNRLAAASGELALLAVSDREQLIYLAKAQGAAAGMRFDIELGTPVALSASASGLAWLASLGDERALQWLERQGGGEAGLRGSAAAPSLKALLASLVATRSRGWAEVDEIWAPGVSALATAVRGGPERAPFAVLGIAGPSLRLDGAARQRLAPELLRAAVELGATSPLFSYLRSLNAAAGPAAEARA